MRYKFWCFSLLLLTPLLAAAGDWPQYRADSGRTGYTPEELPDQLHLQWTYAARHAPQPAWPDVYWQRQTYDLAYQPVVAGGMLFYGSSADGKIYALDAVRGHQRWSFFTDAPVRFAPVVWRDRVYVASDDGQLYCLGAADGRLLWQRPGGPDRQRILGNGRMMARCPIRGGPVLHEDVLYFGAGIFPTQGFFLHAIDPDTGRTLWTNDTSGNMRAKHITGGFAFGNVASQGYLSVDDQTLVVPTGRAVPAAFERATGAFRYFHALELSYTGGSWNMAMDGMVFNSDLILDADTGYTVCNKVGNPEESIAIRNRPRDAEQMIQAAASPERIFVGTGQRIKAIDRANVLDRDSNIWDQTEMLYFKWRGPRATELSPHRAWATRDLWSVEVGSQGTVIVAGDKVYAGGVGVVSALHIPTRQLVWSQQVEGTAHGLAVAGGRLYASTDAGRIYCFGAEPPAGEAGLLREQAEPPPDAGAQFQAAARAIVERLGVTEGYCLDFGCGRGELAYALARQTDLHIIAVDEDAANVAEARRMLSRAGLYGVRVSVLQVDLQATRLPNHFADLIVSGRSVERAAPPEGDWRRSLRPYGGSAAFGSGKALQTEQRGALPGAGSWTHQFGNAANTSCSEDQLLKAPLGVLWFGGSGPAGMHGEKARSPNPLSIDGRLYVQGRDFLRCINAYNGRVMWETSVPSFPWTGGYNGSEVVGSNYCVTSDSVYYSALEECLRLDGRTGEQIGSFPRPELGQRENARWMQVFVKDDLLYGTLESPRIEKGYPRPDTPELRSGMLIHGLKEAPEATHLFAMDRHTGRLRWSYAAEDLIIPNSIALGNGRVYLIDRPVVNPAELRRGAEPADPGRLLALDATSGKRLWSHAEDVAGSMLAVSEAHDVVVMGSDVKERGTLFSDYPQMLVAFHGGEGRKLWAKSILCRLRPMIVGRTVIAEGFDLSQQLSAAALARHYPSAWDLLTGEVRTRANPVTGEEEAWIYGRGTKCSYASGSANMVFFRNAMKTYYDLIRDDGQASFGSSRPSCFINQLPAGGIVLAPDTFTGCQCNTIMRTTMALEPIEQQDHWTVFNGKEPDVGEIRHLQLNLGAPGDRRDDHGRLWFAFPRPPGYFYSHRSDMKTLRLDNVVSFAGLKTGPLRLYDMAAALEEATGIRVRRANVDGTLLQGSQTPWVSASHCEGDLTIRVNVSRMPPQTEYRIRLHFAELDEVAPGERVFDVLIGDRTVAQRLDVVAEAGGTNRTLTREHTATATNGRLEISAVARHGSPILNGLEILALLDRETARAADTGF